VNTTQQVGGALGLAVLATLSTTRTDSLLGDSQSNASALTGGYHLAFIIGAGLVLAAIAVATTVLEPVPVRDEQEEPERIGREQREAEPAYSEAA
jgi:hypothetical protein